MSTFWQLNLMFLAITAFFVLAAVFIEYLARKDARKRELRQKQQHDGRAMEQSRHATAQ